MCKYLKAQNSIDSYSILVTLLRYVGILSWKIKKSYAEIVPSLKHFKLINS